MERHNKWKRLLDLADLERVRPLLESETREMIILEEALLDPDKLDRVKKIRHEMSLSEILHNNGIGSY